MRVSQRHPSVTHLQESLERLASLTTAKGWRLTAKPSDFAQGPSASVARDDVSPEQHRDDVIL